MARDRCFRRPMHSLNSCSSRCSRVVRDDRRQASLAGEEARPMVERKRDTPTDMRPMIEDLRELVQALDRRVPQLERRGETDIVRDAEALKNKALERIADLESAGAHQLESTIADRAMADRAIADRAIAD